MLATGPPSPEKLALAAPHLGLASRRADIAARLSSPRTPAVSDAPPTPLSSRSPSLDDFCEAIEDELLQCGIDARRRWKGATVGLQAAIKFSKLAKSP